MNELLMPWLELCILFPALGALRVKFTRDPDAARRQSLMASGLTLACSIMAWQDFRSQHLSQAQVHAFAERIYAAT